MRVFTEADFRLDEFSECWESLAPLVLFGATVQLTASQSTAATIERSQVDTLNRFLREEGQLRALVGSALLTYRSELAQSWEDQGAPSADAEIWRFAQPILLHIPCHYRSKDRHVFIHFKLDLDEEHGVELYLRNETLAGIGPIECRWQEAEWLTAEQERSQVHAADSIEVPGTTLIVPIPTGWVDTTESFKPFLENWRNQTFIKKLEQYAQGRSQRPQVTLSLFCAMLPDGVSLEEYRENLAAAHRKRNDDISYQGYSGWILESHSSKVMALKVGSSLFVYQLRSDDGFEECRRIWEWLP
jgi:hypothetical protein